MSQQIRFNRSPATPYIVTQQIHPLVALSLFSGAGGLDIGFHHAGFKIVACIEKDSTFSKTLELNRGCHIDFECQILNRDIQELEPEEINVECVDFIIGGPPCQSFSAIGRRAGGIEGIYDQRGGLFEHYCRLVKHYSPEGFLFENVRGILGSNKGKDWQRIVETFASLGYYLSYKILDAADYGVPQHRERLILVGTRISNFKFPRPTHGPDSIDKLPHVSALQAIADLQDPDEPTHSYTGKYGKLLEEVPPGRNYSYFTKELGYPQPIFAWRSRFSDFLYKSDPDKPVRTIVAQLGKYSGPFHWKNRKFTLQEFKRLQTFPDDYKFAGGLNSALQQIGNSVPPAFAEKLASAVLQQLFGMDLGIDLIEQNERLSFDSRKASKAHATRSKRGSIKVANDLPLFADVETLPMEEKTSDLTEKMFHYIHNRRRIEIASPQSFDQGRAYRFLFKRTGDRCHIDVSRYNGSAFIEAPRLKYRLQFHHPVGDGVRMIECTLNSDSDEDIAIAWDAIEDCLSSSSGYKSLLDVFGHFTEPHPIFDLELDVLTNEPSFVLQFAKKFSSFEATTKLLPSKALEELYSNENDQKFDLTQIARYLRELRFDVRVHETNRAIPSGYFRCCYPFTLSINRQVFVTWKQTV